MKVAVVGVTGVVGTVLLKLLEEREFPVSEIIPVASEKSVGNKIMFKGQDYKIVSLDDAVNMKPDIALFLLVAQYLWSGLQSLLKRY
jgi:aspartate-semialdehyde dehydrogenase